MDIIVEELGQTMLVLVTGSIMTGILAAVLTVVTSF